MKAFVQLLNGYMKATRMTDTQNFKKDVNVLAQKILNLVLNIEFIIWPEGFFWIGCMSYPLASDWFINCGTGWAMS